MENPLELPAPPEKEAVQRIQALARDIAYGAVRKMWTSHLRVEKSNDQARFVDQGLNQGLTNKWEEDHNYYSVHLLVSFGYLVKSNVDEGYRESSVVFYDITPKAFALLEKPATPPSVFISYKQDQSSALALLIEARLKLQDDNINIFIDKLLQAGDDWETRLEDTVRGSRFFVVLISKETLALATIQKEIKWAYDAGCTIIAICHNSYKIDADFPAELKGKQAIMIERESAKHYESAISDLLNGMGYSTY